MFFISHRKQAAQPGIEWANIEVVATIMYLEATNLDLGSVFMWGALESMMKFLKKPCQGVHSFLDECLGVMVNHHLAYGFIQKMS